MSYPVTTRPKPPPRPRTPEEIARRDERIRPNGNYVLGAIRECAAKLYQRLAAVHRLAALPDTASEYGKASATCEPMGRRVLEAMAKVEAIFAAGPHCGRENMLVALAAWGKLIDIGDRLDVICDLLPGRDE